MDKIKRIDIETKSKNSFIGCWSLENKKLMDDIVNFFNKNNQLHEVGKLVGGRIDRNVKVSAINKEEDISIIKINDKF